MSKTQKENNAEVKPDLSGVLKHAEACGKAFSNARANILKEYKEGYDLFRKLTGKPNKPSTVNAYHTTIRDTIQKAAGWKKESVSPMLSYLRSDAKLPKNKREKPEKIKSGKTILSLKANSEETKIIFGEEDIEDKLHDLFSNLMTGEYKDLVLKVLKVVAVEVERKNKVA